MVGCNDGRGGRQSRPGALSLGIGAIGMRIGDCMGLSGLGTGFGAALSLVARAGAVGCCCLALAQCGGSMSKLDPKYGVSASPRVVQLGEPVPKGGGTYR